MYLYLLHGESLITESNNKHIQLTTHRIRQQDDSVLVCLMLDQISAIRVQIRIFSVWLWLSGATFLGAVVELYSSEGIAAILFIASGVFLILFFATRRHVITISSDSASIHFHTRGMNSAAVSDFIHKVEEARTNLMKF